MTTRIMKIGSAAALTAVVLLTGCNATQQAAGTAAAGLAGNTAQIAGNVNVQQACVAAAPLLNAAAASANPSVSSTASYGNAFCGPVLAGTMPPTAPDSNSASWVVSLISTLAPLVLGAL